MPQNKKTHAPAGRWSRVLRWTAVGVAVLVVVATMGGYLVYRNLYGNITHEDVTQQLGDKRPPKVGKATNILVLGSDAGTNDYDPDKGKRSDTIILLHLSPNNEQGAGVSFPRDSIVRIPACRNHTTHKPTRPHTGMINSAFSTGGAACTWKTIEANTGIHIDHFVKLDFYGFKDVVDALGGVRVCPKQAIHNQHDGITLRPGCQNVMGEQALLYVHERKGVGDGSDLQRIQRQQQFMSAVVDKATDSGLLTSPTRLYEFLSAATKVMTTDSDFDISAMRKLAGKAKSLGSDGVCFMTVPNKPWSHNRNRVAWAQPAAKRLFSAIKADRPVQTWQSGSKGSAVGASPCPAS